MPLIKIHTSTEADAVRMSTTMKTLSAELATITGKPERVIMVTYNTGPVVMAGENVEGAFVEIRGIGGLDKDTNVTLTKMVCDILEADLNLDPAHVYVNFIDMPRENWGWNDKTFA